MSTTPALTVMSSMRRWDASVGKVVEDPPQPVTLVCGDSGCDVREFYRPMNGYAWYDVNVDANPSIGWASRRHEGEAQIGDDFEAGEEWFCTAGHVQNTELGYALETFHELVSLDEDKARESIMNDIGIEMFRGAEKEEDSPVFNPDGTCKTCLDDGLSECIH